MMEKDEGAGQNVRFDAYGWGWGVKCGDRVQLLHTRKCQHEEEKRNTITCNILVGTLTRVDDTVI